MRAPRSRCRPWSGVCRNGADSAETDRAHLRQHGRNPRPGDAPSVVDPERFTAADPPSGSRPRLTPSVSDPARWPAAAFQSALPPAVLLPESFRGGCSFGAAPPGQTRARPLLRACIQRGLCTTAEDRKPAVRLCRPSAARSAPAKAPVELDDLGGLLKADGDIEIARGPATERDRLLDVLGDPGALRPGRDRNLNRERALAHDRLVRAGHRDEVLESDRIASCRRAALANDDDVQRSA